MTKDVYTLANKGQLNKALNRKPPDLDGTALAIRAIVQVGENEARSFAELMVQQQAELMSKIDNLANKIEGHKQVNAKYLQIVLSSPENTHLLTDFEIRREKGRPIIYYKGSKESWDINKGFLVITNGIQNFIGMKDVKNDILSHAIIKCFLQQELNEEAGVSDTELTTLQLLVVQTAKHILHTAHKNRRYITIAEIKRESALTAQLTNKDIEFVLTHSGFELVVYNGCRNKQFKQVTIHQEM